MSVTIGGNIMRELLFRGKRVDNGEWVYGLPMYDSICQKIDKIEVPQIGGGIGVSIIPETIGQFTGLTDKNEVKIFEGDVLKCMNSNDGAEYTTGFIASLVNGLTFTNTTLTRELALYDDDWPAHIEVIGNIHE